MKLKQIFIEKSFGGLNLVVKTIDTIHPTVGINISDSKLSAFASDKLYKVTISMVKEKVVSNGN